MHKIHLIIGLFALVSLLASGCASTDSTSGATPSIQTKTSEKKHGNPQTSTVASSGQTKKQTTAKSAQEIPAKIRIYIAANQTIRLNGKKISQKKLIKKIEKLELSVQTRIVLEADPNSLFSTVIEVLRTLKKKGYTNVSMQEAKK